MPATLLEGHCLEAMKIVHHHANGRFHWLLSEHQIVNPSREAISILSEKKIYDCPDVCPYCYLVLHVLTNHIVLKFPFMIFRT